MFICSVRAGTLKFFGAVLLALSLLVTLLVLAEPSVTAAGGVEDAEEAVSYSGIKTEADRIAFLAAFGWEVNTETPASVVSFALPEELDRVMSAYNELQRAQGLDLARYKGKTVTRYSYELTNYAGYEGKVYANLIMYKSKVIAADICSADPFGFVHGLTK